MHILLSTLPSESRMRFARIRNVGLVITVAAIFAIADVPPLGDRAKANQDIFPTRVTIVAFDTQCVLEREEVPSGFMELILENHAARPRGVQLVQTDGSGASRYTGGVAGLQPGASQAVVAPVNEGLVTAICSDTQDGSELARFEITVNSAMGTGSQAPLGPDGQSTIELGRDCNYSLLSPVRRESLWVVRNTADDVQDLRVLAVPAGVTPSEIASLFADMGVAPEGMEAGGMALLSPGEEASLRVSLASGEYLAWCSVYAEPDGAFDKPLFEIVADSPESADSGVDLAVDPSTSDPGLGGEDEMLALPGLGTALQPFSVIEDG